MKKLTLLAAVLLAVTLIHPAWIELFGIDPDHGSGAVEVILAVALAVVVLALSARIVLSAVRSNDTP